MRRFPAPLIVVTVLFALFLLPGIVAADQTLPFTPMGNVTGNYTLQQGNDQWIVNTNIPLSTEDICYPMVVWLILVLIGVSFIFLAVIFIARSDNVPSIAILMCGIIAFGIGYAASVMAPLVGEVRTYLDVLPSSTSGVVANLTNTVYLNTVIVYTASPWMSYACWGIGTAGFVIAVAGVLSFFGVFQRKGLAQAQKGDFLEQDVQGQDPEVIRWREREPRK